MLFCGRSGFANLLSACLFTGSSGLAPGVEGQRGGAKGVKGQRDRLWTAV